MIDFIKEFLWMVKNDEETKILLSVLLSGIAIGFSIIRLVIGR